MSPGLSIHCSGWSTGAPLGFAFGAEGTADGEALALADGDADFEGLVLSRCTPPNGARPLGVALGDAFAVGGADFDPPDGFADGLAEPDAPADGLGDSVGCGCPEPTAATRRKRSCAVCLTVSTRFWGFWPGTSTTMLRPPCVETSASVTPVPLTRWSMMPRASSRLAAEGFSPLSVVASRVIR